MLTSTALAHSNPLRRKRTRTRWFPHELDVRRLNAIAHDDLFERTALLVEDVERYFEVAFITDMNLDMTTGP
jgi:hypothetical protein